MASTGQYIGQPEIGQTQISTANANRDGTGTMGTLLTGKLNGTRVTYLEVTATSTTTAGMIRFFIDATANGGGIRMWREMSVTAATPSATVKAFNDIINLNDTAYVLRNGDILKVSTHNAETFNVHAFGGDY